MDENNYTTPEQQDAQQPEAQQPVYQQPAQPAYQQPAYQQPAYQQQAVSNDGKGFSIAALVLGILGIVGSFIPVVCYFTLVCAILGIVFGVKGRKMSTAAYGKASGLATAGLVLGIIGTSFAAIGVICVLSAAACASAVVSSYPF